MLSRSLHSRRRRCIRSLQIPAQQSSHSNRDWQGPRPAPRRAPGQPPAAAAPATAAFAAILNSGPALASSMDHIFLSSLCSASTCTVPDICARARASAAQGCCGGPSVTPARPPSAGRGTGSFEVPSSSLRSRTPSAPGAGVQSRCAGHYSLGLWRGPGRRRQLCKLSSQNVLRFSCGLSEAAEDSVL